MTHNTYTPEKMLHLRILNICSLIFHKGVMSITRHRISLLVATVLLLAVCTVRCSTQVNAELESADNTRLSFQRRITGCKGLSENLAYGCDDLYLPKNPPAWRTGAAGRYRQWRLDFTGVPCAYGRSCGQRRRRNQR